MQRNVFRSANITTTTTRYTLRLDLQRVKTWADGFEIKNRTTLQSFSGV